MFREQQLQPYPPMPPLLGEQLPDGRTERTIAVGLLPIKGEHHHEIVGVNMSRRTIIRFENHAPSSAQAHNPICGLPYANQTTASNVPGQVWITVKQGSTTLWKFLAVRPGASSGTNGSGVELRFVDYRGKRVLYNGHNLVAYSAGKMRKHRIKIIAGDKVSLEAFPIRSEQRADHISPHRQPRLDCETAAQILIRSSDAMNQISPERSR